MSEFSALRAENMETPPYIMEPPPKGNPLLQNKDFWYPPLQKISETLVPPPKYRGGMKVCLYH